ncbi:MAG: hypothetical protein AAFZ07_29820, partial [Actinomycetota bacterium]
MSTVDSSATTTGVPQGSAVEARRETQISETPDLSELKYSSSSSELTHGSSSNASGSLTASIATGVPQGPNITSPVLLPPDGSVVASVVEFGSVAELVGVVPDVDEGPVVVPAVVEPAVVIADEDDAVEPAVELVPADPSS